MRGFWEDYSADETVYAGLSESSDAHKHAAHTGCAHIFGIPPMRACVIIHWIGYAFESP